MPITKTDAQTSIKNINADLAALTPTALITLFEIDVGNLLDDKGFIVSDSERLFRFHNNVKLTNNSIYFKGYEYIAAPVQDSGWAMNSRGTLPTPKLALSVSEEGIPILALFKAQIKRLSDLTGAKVTRIRTFAKYLDNINFPRGEAPNGFSPDSKAELPRDVFFIDRKSNENKFVIEFELASILDVEGVKLPNRVIYAERCPFIYRGEGCNYEIEENRVEAIHGSTTEGATLLASALPVANEKNELISDIIFPNKITTPLQYDPTKTYNIGNSVWIVKDNIKYYFVAKVNNPGRPPNLNQWEPDICSKTVKACKLRFESNLPFGGFPTVDKVR